MTDLECLSDSLKLLSKHCPSTEEAANALSLSLKRMALYEQIERKIICVRNDPSLSRLQKKREIKHLTILKDQI